MLGDIASTSKIFSQIVRERLEIPENYKYLGLDLGSGTGIMLLAQKIQARRNRFLESNITNVGFEIQKIQADRSNELASILDFGGIIVGDTTKKEIFEGIDDNRKISYITNETIPNPGISMTGENDPFFQNFENLYKNYGGAIDKKTRIFPRNLLVNFRVDGPNGKAIIDKNAIANRENGYLIDFFGQIEEQMLNDENFNLPQGRRVYNQIKPIGITLGDKTSHKLEGIGEDLVKSFKVNRLSNERLRRWKIGKSALLKIDDEE